MPPSACSKSSTQRWATGESVRASRTISGTMVMGEETTTAWPTPKFADYLTVWQSLRGDNPLPILSRYFDVAPPEIQRWMGMVDVNSDSLQPMRLLGTGLVDFFGGD